MPETKFENKVRILIVDDEVIIAADLELRLKALGYMVCAQATCGERALELVEKHHPDLVMMDIVIQGGMDGIDTAEVIRNKWGIPVIFQTAYADSERLKRARLAYPFGYLLKPYQDKDLKVTVEMALYIGRVDAKRLEAEKSIRRETAWRKMLVHGSRDGIVVLDQAGKVFEANRKFADILGYEPEEVLDLHVWDWDAQWDKDHLLHMIEIVDEQGEHFETRHRRKDGTLIDVEISTNGALQEDEKLVFCVCRDITERKQAEDLLRHSEERYRTILEIAMDGFCLVDSTGRLLQVNESYCKMTGYTEQELLSMTLNDIESLEIEETTASHLQRIIAEGKDRFESRHRKKDGSLFDVEVSMQYSDENGGLFAAFLRDITYQKRQHEDLRFQSMVLDQIRDHVTVTDLNGFILYINQVVADTLGRSRNELLGQSTITYGEDPMRGATQREIVEQAIRDGFWRGEVVNYSANGSAIFFDCRVQKIHDQQGNPASLCGIATDITERKRAEEKLKTSEECYRLIADNTTDSIWALDSGLRFTYLSPSTERLFGYTLGEWQTLDWGEFVHPEYLEKVRQLFAGIQQGETDNVAAEIKVRRKDKVELWVEYRAAAVRGRDGRLSGIVGVTRDITDRKQGEQAVRKKLAAVLEPEGDIGSLELADIIDADAVQSMMDDFYRLTNIGVAVLDLQGRILVATGWQDICTKYHRVHPTTARYCRESDLELSSGIEPGRFKAYRCKNQMWDMATPIVVGSRHMGNLFLGQFFFEDETPDRDMFRSQARRYGYDEAEYLAALERVPRWSRETVDAVMTFYAKLARIISTLSYSNVKLVRVLTEKDKLLGSLRENEAATKALLDAIPGAAFLIDPQGTIVTHNRELARRLDASERQIIGRNIYDLLPIEVASHRRSKIEEVLRTGRPLRFEDDRDDRRIYNSIYPVIDPEGRVGRLAVFGADITESKKAKKALQESEQRKELALAGAKLGTWDWNVATGEVIFDERWAEILGYRLDELEPQVSAWERLIHPADVQDVMSILDDHLAGLSEHYETEYRLRHKDGHFVWILDKGRVIERDAESNPVRVCGTHLDITKRKIAEERRQEGFNLLNNLARLVPGVIYQYKLNPDGSSAFPYSSPGMWDIYEVTPEEVREDASVVFGRLHPEDHDRVAEAIFESARTLNTFQCELRVILPEQGLRWRWSQAHPERTEDGGTLWHGIILDITESKQAKEALEKSEERHRTILKTAMDGLWLVDLDGRILQVNDAYCRMSGYTEQELLSMKISDLDVDESPFDTASHLEKIIDQGVDRFETRHRRKNGDVFEVEISTTYQPLEGGRIVGFLRDITDSRKAAEEREKLQAQLQQAQKMEAIGTLAGGVSHDFNNLLQAINGYAQLLLLEKSDTDPEYDSLKAIQDAGFRASYLVRQLLLFSRKADSTRRPIELQNEVEQAKKILGRTIPKMVDIQLSFGTRLWTINADAIQIEQMLLNLGTNAADAMPDGGKLIFEVRNLTLNDELLCPDTGVQPGRYVLLTVSDTGHGMDKATIEKIFEPFFTTKEFGKGTGLGLASVYGIVKNHGGYITCHSEAGQGTTFEIYFPAIVQPEVGQTREVETKPIPRGTETVLLVDDEESIRGFAEQALMKFGYKVWTASTGEEALQLYLAKPNEIDLVVMDLGMPGMGGHKCLPELLKINPAVKVVIASGYSISGQVKKTMDAGARGFVGKPYQLADLLNTVRATLDEES